MKVYCVSLLLISLTVAVDSAKILGIFNFPSKSQHTLGESLLKALAAKGHDVTMLSPYRTKAPPKNYKELVLPELIEYKDAHMTSTIMSVQNQSALRSWSMFMSQIAAIEDIFYNHKAVTELIKSNKRFDLAVVAWFGSDGMLALSHHLANSTIAFSTIGSTYMIKKLTKVPMPYSYVPNIFPPFPDEMTLTQRLGNSLTYVFGAAIDMWSGFGQNAIIKKYFPHAPSLHDLYHHVSLIFLNTHYSIESPRPYVPNMIQVGGLHLEEPKKLTGELQKFMDDANEGVIFFSLGSNARSADIPQDQLDGIIKCFSNLPYKVLWKFEKSAISNLPNNVKISKWLPQRDILAHKNLKLFITHGGLLSTIEALYSGVPMIGIPMFGDQEANVKDGVVKGYLLELPYKTLSEQTLNDAIYEVMNDARYRENVQIRSRVFRDQPMKPIDTAVYWVEYVLRHNGAHHLKTSAHKLWWYQYYLLDVIAVILAPLLGGIFIICKIFKSLRKLLCNRTKKETKKETQKETRRETKQETRKETKKETKREPKRETQKRKNKVA